MVWETPKTDWYGATVDGKYEGDRFNYWDYNRLKNNLLFLQDISYPMYPRFEMLDMGIDRDYASPLYAEDMEDIFQNLKVLNSNTVNLESIDEWIDTSGFEGYFQNSRTMSYRELNFFEQSMLDIYNALEAKLEKLRRLPFILNGGEF